MGLLVGLGLLVGAAPAQRPAVVQSAEVAIADATVLLPWQISMARVREAMAGASYEIEQERRVLQEGDVGSPGSWIGLRERLRHHPAAGGRQERFSLDLLGLIGTKASDPDRLGMAAKEHESIQELLFHYQSFHIADAGRAARNYSLTWLGLATRLDRPVHRVAVVPRRGDRPSWLLELDVRTSYPLYRGQYDQRGELVSEVEVVRYDATFDRPLRDRSGAGQERYPSPIAAFQAAGLSVSAEVAVPRAELLPDGYGLLSSKVAVDLLSGKRKVILTYSDGVDQLFFLFEQTSEPQAPGHELRIYRDTGGSGMTQCQFVDNGLSYLVIGREDPMARQAAWLLYAQVIQG